MSKEKNIEMQNESYNTMSKFADRLVNMGKKAQNDINDIRVQKMVNLMCDMDFKKYNQKQITVILQQILLESRIEWRKRDGIS